MSNTDTPDSDSLLESCGDTKSSSGSSLPPQTTVPKDQHASAFAFLRASFPDLAPVTLSKKLDEEECSGDFSMEKLVEELLTEDFVKELEERGLEDDGLVQDRMNKEGTTAETATSPTIAKTPRSKKSKKRGRTIVLNDVRQRNQPDYSKVAGTHAAGDPWSQVLSTSSFLASLLPAPSSFFSSYFHRPQFSTPSDALRAALSELIEKSKNKAKVDPDTLQNLYEVFSSSLGPENCDEETLARHFSDAELVLKAANGSADVGLDILRLLHELDNDKDGSQELGLYHSPASPLWTSTPTSSPATTPSVASLTSNVVTRTVNAPFLALPYTPPAKTIQLRPPPAPSEYKWQHVKVRPKKPDVNLLAAYIPAYNAQNAPRRKGKAVPLPGASRGQVSAVQSRREAAMGGYRARIEAARDKRNELLREASRHWASGNSRSHGGEVALYYAMQAQQHQEEVHKLELQAAREFVNQKRFAFITRASMLKFTLFSPQS